MHTQQEKQKKAWWPFVLAALMFGTMLALGRKIQFSGDVHESYTQNTFDDFAWTDLAVFAAAAVGAFVLLLAVDRLYDAFAQPLKRKAFDKKLFVICFAVLCLCWLPFFLKDFPGSVLGDSFGSIQQALGDAAFSNHFPVVYTLFVGIFLKIGAAMGSLTVGVFLYSLTQYVLLAAVYAYFLTWLDSKGVRRWYIVASLLFFAIPQTFAMQAVVMWKDPLFTAFLLLLTMQLADAAQSQGKLLCNQTFLVKWALLLLGIIFFRNNGLYIAAGLLVLLPIVYRKQAVRVGVLTLCVIVVSCIVTGPIYTACGVEKDSVVESLGVPIQQMAYVVTHDGEMNDTEREAVTSLLPEEEYKRVYTPCLVDSIKWDYGHFDDYYLEHNTVHLLKCWGTMCLKNFPSYVKAYCLETFGYWKIGARNGYGDMVAGISEGEGWDVYDLHTTDVLQRLPGGAWLSAVQDKLQIHFSIGTLFALWVLELALLLRRKAYPFALVLAPGALLWLTLMLAAPVAFGVRYAYLLLAGFPLIPVVPVLAGNKNQQEEK